MFTDLRLSVNGDGSFDVIINLDSFSAEFGSHGGKEKSEQLVSRFLKLFDKQKTVRYIRVISGGVLIAIITLTPVTQAQASAEQLYSMSYIYFGSEAAQIAGVASLSGALNTVSPSYFNLTDGGNLDVVNVSTTFVSSMHSRSVTVVPFLSNHWNRSQGEKALDNADALSTQIADAVKKYNLDGVNVDIENVTETYRAKYVTFVKLLRQKLPSSKELSVAVAANPNSLSKGWQGSYDYEGLSEYADYLMVMAYDEHYQSGPAGPVAGSSFVERSIQYALQHVPKEKLVLGLPFYGRIWGGNADGIGVSLPKTDELIAKYDGKITYDSATQSVKAVFTIKAGDAKPVIYGKTLSAGTYTVWYEDSQSIRYKLSLITKYGLKGAGSWSLGQENAQVRSAYSAYVQGILFNDIENYWARESIQTLATKGIFLGVSPNTFAPNQSLTRAEAAVLICRMRGLSADSNAENRFTDIGGHWAEGYINAAGAAGLVGGVGNDRFEPDRPMTREEISAMLYRLMGLQGSAPESAPVFSDVGTDRWSYNEIESLANAGIVSGYAGGVFAPQKPVTRGEMAELLARIDDYLGS